MKEPKYIEIKGEKIPFEIRSYKTSKHLKMYFKADTLCISKPKYVSVKNDQWNHAFFASVCKKRIKEEHCYDSKKSNKCNVGNAHF